MCVKNSRCSPGLDDNTVDLRFFSVQLQDTRESTSIVLTKMTYPHGSGEYKDLLDSNGDPSLENAECHQEFKPLSVKKVKSFVLHNPWIFHLAMVILYSTLFILIAWKDHAQHFHGPGLIFCMCGQSRSQNRISQVVAAPARDAVEYEKVTFNGSFIIDSPFTGVRRPEQDEVWHDLLQSL